MLALLFVSKGEALQWVSNFLIIFVVAIFGYYGSRDSSKDPLALMINALLIAIVVAGIAFAYESTDLDSTFESQSAAAVGVFLRVGFGGCLGCYLAYLSLPKSKK
jgi:uncharacterized membrane protein AbrB (regulator of aidB expression)